jgi:hypothetical protein
MSSSNPLMPIPKIWIPAVAALVAIVISWVISGDFAEAELAALLTTAGYFVLGYVLPGDSTGTSRTRGRDAEAEAARGPADSRAERY